MSPDPLAYEQSVLDAGLHRGEHRYQGAVRDVYRGGDGPSVIVLSELPGIARPTLDLCRRLMRAGYRVVLPQLVGIPGRPISAGAVLATLAQVCVSREFELLALRRESPITEWLRSLARAEHAERGGPGVGVIGMCITGGFALAMLLEPAVVAPVMSQPSCPPPWTPAHACSLAVSDPDLTLIKARLQADDLSVLGLRFTADRLVPAARFRRLREELGERFVAIEIDSRWGNAHGIRPWAHSVLTVEFVDDKAHPTQHAFEQVLALFARRLIVTAPSLAK